MSATVRPLSADEIRRSLTEVSGWSVRDGKLFREFRFRDFLSAFAFMQAVAQVAESMNHHPEWSNVYNRVRVELVTHDAAPPVGAISAKDFDLAREMSRLASAQPN